MTRDVVVRAAQLADSAEIASVHVDSWRDTYSRVLPDRFFDDAALLERERMWSSILRMHPLPGTVVVAVIDERVVGFAFAGSAEHPDARKGIEPARDLHLFSIYLRAADQGTGIGRALLDAAIGSEPAQLWVLRSNERARAFYSRHGFETDGVEVIDPDLPGLVEIRMVR